MVGQISKIVTALVNRIVIWKHFYQVLWRSITPKALLRNPVLVLMRRIQFRLQEQRALPIRVITVGKKRSLGVQLVVDEYIGKLKYYCKVEDVQLRSNPKNTGDVKAQIKDEDMAVMNIISSDDWVVVLDENGLDIGSEQMAELMGDAGSTGASRISFCIGGPYGHGPKMRERANISIKLSSMVLNHQIALLVLVEQLYRSWTILKGQNYHH